MNVRYEDAKMTDEPRENPAEQPENAEEAAQDKQGAQTEAPRATFDDFVEHQRRAFEATKKALKALIPPDFKTYGEEACKEFFAAFKALVESAGAAVEAEMNKKHSEPGEDKGGSGPSTTGKTKVKVEVN
jgi:DNA-binding SARP family transcriptional activator